MVLYQHALSTVDCLNVIFGCSQMESMYTQAYTCTHTCHSVYIAQLTWLDMSVLSNKYTFSVIFCVPKCNYVTKENCQKLLKISVIYTMNCMADTLCNKCCWRLYDFPNKKDSHKWFARSAGKPCQRIKDLGTGEHDIILLDRKHVCVSKRNMNEVLCS